MRRLPIAALLVLGITALSAQIVIIRELFITFNGNELTIGITLANWIIAGALGSWYGSRCARRSASPHIAYACIQIITALTLPLAVIAIRMLTKGAGGIGEEAGIGMIMAASLTVVAGTGFFVNAQFPLGCRMLRPATGAPAPGVASGIAYALEALGFLVAGPVITYILLPAVASITLMAILGLVNICSAYLFASSGATTRAARYLRSIAALGIIGGAIFLTGPADALDRLTLTYQWRSHRLMHTENSIYGNLAVTNDAGQYTFYANGRPVITTPVPDVASIEELVHLALSSHPSPRRILLIGGGAGGIINEVAKYADVSGITYVELDPALIKLVQMFPTALTTHELSDRRVKVITMDGRRFLKTPPVTYDVIIAHVPLPTTLQLNRFYTDTCFAEIRRALSPDGIYALALPGSATSLGNELRDIHGCIAHTLGNALSITVIPGEQTVYLASAQRIALTPELASERLRDRGITTATLHLPYMRERMDAQWQEWFQRTLAGYAPLRRNEDMRPIGSWYAIRYWSALASPPVARVLRLINNSSGSAVWAGLAALCLLGAFVNRAGGGADRRAVGGMLITAGFAGMGLNLILIYAYQSLYGFVFHALALLIAAFMGGCALGAWGALGFLHRKNNERLLLIGIECMTMVTALGIGGVLGALSAHPSGAGQLVIVLFCALAGLCTGSEFPIAVAYYARRKDAPTEPAGILYALDLVGSWAAALTVSVILMPLAGVVTTCIFIASLKALSLVAFLIAKK